MKFYLLPFLIFLSLALSAQTKPDTTAALAPAAKTPAPTLRDFNYSFYPYDLYQRYSSVKQIDTLTRAFKTAIDTSQQQIQVAVEKTDDLLIVKGLADPTLVFYRANVKFVGVTNDGKNTLIYQALTKDREYIYVNPVLGYVIVAFSINCIAPGHRPGDCDETFHYFGNVQRRK